MVGLVGAVGNFDRDTSALSESICYVGDEVSSRHTVGDAAVSTVFHPGNTEPQPVQIESTGELLWVWGNVYGYLDSKNGYISKDEEAPSISNTEYCAHLYEQYGPKFIAGLNGSFVGCLFDEKSQTIRFFTDQLGSRPMHYTITEEGVVFATQIQALTSFVDDLSFDMEFVCEFLSFERSLGRKTPIEGVKRAHPGAITQIDLTSQSEDVDVQWRPVHEPLDQPFEEFVDTFSGVFESAIRERYDPDEEIGVLLSGGSDSRLIMGALPDEGVTGYHVNDWKNREARIAERVADVAGKPFVYLERDGDHWERSLKFGSKISNYTSWFQHGHAGGMIEELRNRSDILMTGHYSDTLFKHNYLPYAGLLIPGTTTELPLYLEREVRTTDDLVDLYLGTKFHNRKHLRAPPSYLKTGNLRTILENNITDVGKRVNHHGVLHHSPHDAGLFSESYPLTNTAGRLFFDVMLQAAPYRNPFLDVRLIKLMTTLPVEYRLRKNIINALISRVQPELAELPHPRTNIALKYPFMLHYLALHMNWLRDKLSDDEGEIPYHTQGSWPNWDELFRYHDFVKPVLQEQSGLLDAVEWIDTEQLWEDYDRHMSGENRFDELSAMLSFVSMPATQSILASDASRRGSIETVSTTSSKR